MKTAILIALFTLVGNITATQKWSEADHTSLGDSDDEYVYTNWEDEPFILYKKPKNIFDVLGLDRCNRKIKDDTRFVPVDPFTHADCKYWYEKFKDQVNIEDKDKVFSTRPLYKSKNRYVTKWLLEQGANPNAMNYIGKAIEMADIGSVQELLAAGARANRTDDHDLLFPPLYTGKNALHAAADTCDPQIIKTILEAGVSGKEDMLGDTPLHVAARRCTLPAVEALLQGKEHVSTQNKFGKAPIDIATSPAVKELLIKEKERRELMRKKAGLFTLCKLLGDGYCA